MASDLTSPWPLAWIWFSMASTICSICSLLMGRFSQARLMPEKIFCLSKASRRPSFFTTIKWDSTYS